MKTKFSIFNEIGLILNNYIIKLDKIEREIEREFSDIKFDKENIEDFDIKKFIKLWTSNLGIPEKYLKGLK